jgi:hypothetical protein
VSNVFRVLPIQIIHLLDISAYLHNLFAIFIHLTVFHILKAHFAQAIAHFTINQPTQAEIAQIAT